MLDVGAGSGHATTVVLERCPGARVLALEPSDAMRSLALAAVARRPEWFERVTVRPEDFFSAPLPERLGGAVLLGVLGHFDVGERAAVLAELAVRLPAGGAALLDLQDPGRPQRVEPFEYTTARVGDLAYRLIGEAWPVEGERMRWRMTYISLDGERVLDEAVAEHEYHHPDPAVLADQAADVGLRLERLAETTFWLLLRD